MMIREGKESKLKERQGREKGGREEVRDQFEKVVMMWWWWCLGILSTSNVSHRTDVKES